MIVVLTVLYNCGPNGRACPYREFNTYTARPQKKVAHSPLCFDYGAHLQWCCFGQPYGNAATFISIRCNCIHFWPRFRIDDRRVEPFLQFFLLTPNTFIGVKVRTLVANLCVKNTYCIFTLHSFTTRARWILALSPWNMPEPSEKEKNPLMG